MEKYSITFHKKFSPEIQYLCKLLMYSEEIVGLSKEEISEITGVPTGKSSGKVEPHLKYLEYMNLIVKRESSIKNEFRKTSLGNIVLLEDKYLNERITKLLLNYFLTSKTYGADMWNYIFRELPYIYGNKISASIIKNEVEGRYNKKNVILSAFNSTYIKETSFKELALLNIDKESYNFKGINFSYEEMYVYIYTLLKDLEGIDKNRKEFSYEEIFNDIKWNLGYQWSKEYAIYVLEKLEDKGLVQINKQLNPVTIVLNQKSNELESQLYSLLF